MSLIPDKPPFKLLDILYKKEFILFVVLVSILIINSNISPYFLDLYNLIDSTFLFSIFIYTSSSSADLVGALSVSYSERHSKFHNPSLTLRRPFDSYLHRAGLTACVSSYASDLSTPHL